jgi:hypothetical protein
MGMGKFSNPTGILKLANAFYKAADSGWSLWIDDQLDEVPGRKNPPGFLGAKSVEEAKELVIAHGIPEFMDLDHDLGEESVMTFLKWLADEFPDGPVPEWEVHSQNPIGKQNINSFLDSWKRSLAFDINDITKYAQIVEPLGYAPSSPTTQFSKVDDNLYRGGKPSPKHLIHFKRDLGIKKIFSLDGEVGYDIAPFCKSLGLKHLVLPLGDGRDPKVQSLKAYIPYLTNDGPTYIHCYWGKDRTSMAVAMYRIHNGWSLEDALNEAHRFNMGEGLSKDIRDSYYNAVRDFAKEHGVDTSNAQDAVSSSRESNTFGIGNPGVNDMSIPQFSVHFNIPPSTDIEFSHLSRVAAFSDAFYKRAGTRLYCKCKPSKVLKPKSYWHGTPEGATGEGQLFSAQISPWARIESFDGKIDRALIDKVLAKDIDIGVLRNNVYVLINPDVLENIQEEDDVSNIIEVGLRDTSTDVPVAFIGSGGGVGGMPDNAAGCVQLPFSGPGQV